MNVFVLNSGSSSLKFQVIATDLDRIRQHQDERLCRGEVERIGGEAIVTFQKGGEAKHKFTAPLRDIAAALDYLVRYIASDRSGVAEIKSSADIHAVGHRVVHGGEMFTESALIDDRVLQGIEDCIDLAPLHNPNNIRGIMAARELFGKEIQQVAVFDTSFHHTIPEQAYLYAVPYHLYRRHRIRRYGFHGTSHRYVAFRYRALRGLEREQTNIITLHLGNGCSAAAIKGGNSVDTSMGMTPLEGLVMGTRSGDVDPGAILHVMERSGMSAADVRRELNEQSGLLGLSGQTADMRELLALERSGDAAAALAIEVFCRRARHCVAAYIAELGGVDVIVFGGGIGENCPDIRRRIVGCLTWADIELQPEANAACVGVESSIASATSRAAVLVIPVDEASVMAKEAAALLQ